MEYDGLFISNGPGDPDTCDAAVQNIRRAMQDEKLPIFGICMGNQLLSKAGGAKIYKLKYGHRSHNQPVRMVGTERCFITSQNHGYAVDNNTLGADWEPLFVNMNDGSNEGIRHKTNPWFSAQFHPEAAGRRLGTAVRQHERRLERGHPPQDESLVLRPVPPRSVQRPHGHGVPVRRVREDAVM